MSRQTAPLALLAAALFGYALFILWALGGLVLVIAFAWALHRLLRIAEIWGAREQVRVEAAARRRWPGHRGN